jgi:Tfp pilus assembly protein PilV
MAFPRVPAALSSRLSDERGVTLVETLISTVILAIVVGAVLTTIDASGRTAAVNKNRSVAATLAEQDQQRMRAMTPTALAGHTLAQDLRPEGPGGPTYHVDSRANGSSTPRAPRRAATTTPARRTTSGSRRR